MKTALKIAALLLTTLLIMFVLMCLGVEPKQAPGAYGVTEIERGEK